MWAMIRLSLFRWFRFGFYHCYGAGMVLAAAQLIERTNDRIRREPDFADVLSELVGAPTSGAGTYTRNAAQALNGQRLDDVVEEFKADALTTAEVKRLLNLGTPQAVHQLRRRKKVIGVPSGNATWFPAWQFQPGRIRPDLASILEHLARFSTDSIAADRVMRLVRDDLGGRSLSQALDDRHAAPTAWAILASLGA